MTITLQPRNHYEMTLPDGTTVDMPCFTCVHCQRSVTMDPKVSPATEAKMIAFARERGFTDDVMTLWRAQFEESRTCLNCNALTCCEPGCVEDCQNTYETDGPRAARDYLRQPWMLRDAQSYPVDRVRLDDGSEQLVRRRDNGMTERQLAAQVVDDPALGLMPEHIREGVRKQWAEQDEAAWADHNQRVLRS